MVVGRVLIFVIGVTLDTLFFSIVVLTAPLNVVNSDPKAMENACEAPTPQKM